MRKLGSILSKKNYSKKNFQIDEKSLFYVFEKIIKEEYGNRGVENLKADYYKDKKIFIRSDSSNWSNELWLNKSNIIEKINKEIGSREVYDIAI